MPFEVYMERCLYDPELGYYTTAGREVGKRGDFFTSVSVGPVFGELLAGWAARGWERMGRPEVVALVEQGAHDGRLMADVLAAIRSRHGDFAKAVRPVIVEPSAARRAAQSARLMEAAAGAAAGGVTWVAALDEGAALAGAEAGVLFFANELLDAFPVARWRFDGTIWRRMSVGVDARGCFAWVTEPGHGARGREPGTRYTVHGSRFTGGPEAGDEGERPGSRFAGGVADGEAPRLPAGYETETCPGLADWVRALGRAMAGGGHALLIDYGRPAEDYFAPHRSSGTLRGYREHRRLDDPLAAPGETDLTADVNFTDLAGAARRAGFAVRGPERQGAFLTRLAGPRLMECPPPDATWRRQFQTLTHPNHLGHVFHAVELDMPLPGAVQS